MKKDLFNQIILCGFFIMAFTMTISAQMGKLPIADGPYKPRMNHSSNIKYPEWFRDAKLDSGRIGGHRLFPARETGMPEGCIRKTILHINTM